jgi:hypothetical protein
LKDTEIRADLDIDARSETEIKLEVAARAYAAALTANSNLEATKQAYISALEAAIQKAT